MPTWKSSGRAPGSRISEGFLSCQCTTGARAKGLQRRRVPLREARPGRHQQQWDGGFRHAMERLRAYAPGESGTESEEAVR